MKIPIDQYDLVGLVADLQTLVERLPYLSGQVSIADAKRSRLPVRGLTDPTFMTFSESAHTRSLDANGKAAPAAEAAMKLRRESPVLLRCDFFPGILLSDIFSSHAARGDVAVA